MVICNEKQCGIRVCLIGLGLLLSFSCAWAERSPLLPASADYRQKGGVVSTYFPIWKKMFQSVNGLSDAEFDRHIYVRKIFNYGELKDRDFLTVEYFVTVDWFVARQLVTFDIMLPSATDENRSLNVARDTYLSEEEMKLLLAHGGNRLLGKVRVKEPLVFASRQKAVGRLKEALRDAEFSDDKVVMELLDGEPSLSVTAMVDYEQNTCRRGVLGLVTGEPRVFESACYNVN